jgi:L-amino acid N-acyltransferase YncA
MAITARTYRSSDLPAMIEIWNAIVAEANAFPQSEPLKPKEAAAFFAAQSLTAVAVGPDDDGREAVLGLYILHPNNIGRCGHIANSSYAVKSGLRGQRIGELLVRDSLEQARNLGFTILQFNAVVATNTAAIRLYDKLGFHRLGQIPGGFRLGDGTYEAIQLYYIEL